MFNPNSNPWLVKDLKFDGDPVACSWHLHRTNAVPENFRTVLERITEEDRETAVKIRNHFRGKLLLLQLGNKPLTRYRSELLKFLTKNSAYAQEEIGMIMSLPMLYEEDLLLDSLKENYNNTPWKNSEVYNQSVERTLNFINSHTKKSQKYSRSRFSSRTKFTCNWLHDENDRLYLIETEDQCPYRMFWQDIIKKPFTIVGKPIKNHSRDDLYYYELHDWFILNK
jgi:hypothetical protein